MVKAGAVAATATAGNNTALLSEGLPSERRQPLFVWPAGAASLSDVLARSCRFMPRWVTVSLLIAGPCWYLAMLNLNVHMEFKWSELSCSVAALSTTGAQYL